VAASIAIGWRARAGTCARNGIVICGVACIPFAADLASSAHVKALASAHPNSAVSNPTAAPVPVRSEAGSGLTA
jgi:hypothetical protein